MVSDLGKGSRKGFYSGWMLPGSGGNYLAGCLNKSYLEGGRNKAQLKLIGKAATGTARILARTGGCLAIFVVWTVFTFVCVQMALWCGLVLTHLSHSTALSDDVLLNCLCSAGERQGPALSARPALAVGLLFSLSAIIIANHCVALF